MYNNHSVDDIQDILVSLQKFGLFDYTVFIFMLIICLCIGIYFGFLEKKDKSEADQQIRGSDEALNYLVGGRNMKKIPIAMSLVASWISGITLLGTGTEIYLYGTEYMFIILAIIICGFIKAYILLPVFHDLQLTSIYEYFELRFDRRIRLFGSIMSTIGVIIWLPIVIYVPALAFNQVTGTNIYVIIPIVCLVCIFYTCVGGIKAVVWTDVFQCSIMYGIILLIVVKGTINLGGFNTIWERNWNSGRIEAPGFAFSLTERHSAYSVFIGGLIYWLESAGTAQSMVQRYLSIRTLRDVRKTVLIFTISVILLLICCGFIGLLMYAAYHECDPLKTKLAKAKDQLVPLYVMNVLGNLPGVSGFFVAGVFSAALSSLSTSLNSLSAIVLQDFVKPFVHRSLTETETKYLMRISVCVFGVICTALVLIVERLGPVLQLTISLGAMMGGPLFGLFISGLMVPWIKGKSALIGTITSLCFMTWIILRAQADIASGVLTTITKPTSISGCKYIFEAVNQTFIGELSDTSIDRSSPIYHMSYLWYIVFGSFISVFVSTVTILIFGAQSLDEMDPQLYAPFVSRLIRKRKLLYVDKSESATKTEMQCAVYSLESKDDQMIKDDIL